MHVIIVIGEPSSEDTAGGRGNRFEESAGKCVMELRQKFGIDPNDFSYICGNAPQTMRILEQILIAKSSEDICLFYFGHGTEYGWAMLGNRDLDSVLVYDALRLALAHHVGNLLFINVACYAGAASVAFDAHPGKHCLLALVPHDQTWYPYGFVEAIMDAWVENRYFNPRDPRLGKPSETTPVVEGDIEVQGLMFRERRMAS